MISENTSLNGKINPESGFTLIEVLVAIAIMSIGLMATSMMQIRSLNNTTSSRSTMEAMNIAEAEAEALRAMPFYDITADLDGNGTIDNFDMMPDLAAGTHTAPTDATPYTARWTVALDDPLTPLSAGVLDPANPVSRSMTIRVWVTRDADPPNRAMAELEFSKFWSMDLF